MSFFENDMVAEGWPLASSPRLFEDDLLPFEEKASLQPVDTDVSSSLLDAGINKPVEFSSLGNSWLDEDIIDVGLLENLLGFSGNEQLPSVVPEDNSGILEPLTVPEFGDPQVQKLAMELAETLQESLKEQETEFFENPFIKDEGLIDTSDPGYVSSVSPGPSMDPGFDIFEALTSPEALASPASSSDMSSIWSTPSSPYSVPGTDYESSPASNADRPKPYSRPAETVPTPGSSRSTGRRTLSDRKERKKLQNKNAATRYRQKKKEENNLIDSEIQQLERKNRELREKEDQMKREIEYLKRLMSDVYKARGIIK